MPSGTVDHLARAKDYIAVAESADSKTEAYRKAAAEIVAAMEKDSTLSQRVAAERVGKSRAWVRDLVHWHTSGRPGASPFSAESQGRSKGEDPSQVTRRTLRDPVQRREVIESLKPTEVEGLIEEANEVAVQRARAQRAEHTTTKPKPTAGELMGGDRFDPAEFWADTVVIRINNNARELASLIQRGGGLLFGSMDYEKAFEYLNEAERLIAEARAAAQEQVRDRTEVV